MAHGAILTIVFTDLAFDDTFALEVFEFVGSLSALFLTQIPFVDVSVEVLHASIEQDERECEQHQDKVC